MNPKVLYLKGVHDENDDYDKMNNAGVSNGNFGMWRVSKGRRIWGGGFKLRVLLNMWGRLFEAKSFHAGRDVMAKNVSFWLTFIKTRED